MSAIKQRPLAKVIRRAARVIGVGGTLWYLLWLFAAWVSPEFFNTYYIHGTVGIFLAATAVIALAGCIISWWYQWLAGVLLIISWLPLLGPVVFRLGMGTQYNFSDWLGYYLALPVAGLLFLLSWWLSRKTSPPAIDRDDVIEQ